MSRALDSLDREVGGERPAEQVGHGRREGVDRVEDNEENDSTDSRVGLGDLSTLLERDESGELRQLFKLRRRRVSTVIGRKKT